MELEVRHGAVVHLDVGSGARPDPGVAGRHGGQVNLPVLVLHRLGIVGDVRRTGNRRRRRGTHQRNKERCTAAACRGFHLLNPPEDGINIAPRISTTAYTKKTNVTTTKIGISTAPEYTM